MVKHLTQIINRDSHRFVDQEDLIEKFGKKANLPWDRRKNENDRQWGAFQLYRDLGPERTLKIVREETGYNDGVLAAIALRHQWRDRALLYDREMDKIRQAATKLETFNMAARQVRLGKKMQGLAESRLDQYITNPDLQSTITPNDLIRLASEGVKIERLAEGEPTGEEGNQPIIFAIPGLSSLPQWAPKQITENGIIEGNSGNQVQEIPPPAAGDIHQP